jgi:hypothetical protein
MTVEAPSTSSNDAALIGEIAPAMALKLRRDWRQSNMAFGLLFMLGGTHLIGKSRPLVGLSEGWLTAFGVLSLFFSAVFFFLAFFGQGMALKEELHFHRRNGKWRWER